MGGEGVYVRGGGEEVGREGGRGEGGGGERVGGESIRNTSSVSCSSFMTGNTKPHSQATVEVVWE